MADPLSIDKVVGSGAGVAILTWGLSRIGKARAEEKAEINKRLDDMMRERENDRANLQSYMERTAHLEERTDRQDRELAELHSDKLRLEAQIVTLNQQIAELNIQIEVYRQREADFNIQISDLQARLAAKQGELHSAQNRLQAIKEAHDNGTLKGSTLFQDKRKTDAGDML